MSAFSKTYFIEETRMRMYIRSAPDDPWGYDLTCTLNTQADPGDLSVRDQIEFDKVLADLNLINLHAGRSFVNVLLRLSGLEQLSRWYQHRFQQRNTPSILPTQRMRRLDAPPL